MEFKVEIVVELSEDTKKYLALLLGEKKTVPTKVEPAVQATAPTPQAPPAVHVPTPAPQAPTIVKPVPTPPAFAKPVAAAPPAATAAVRPAVPVAAPAPVATAPVVTKPPISPAPVATPVPPTPQPTAAEASLAELRLLLAAKVVNNREAIKAKLSSLGAANLTVLPVELYKDMHDFLFAL